MTTPAEDKTKTTETKDETKTDDKDKSWIRKQRDGVTSKEERKTNTVSNVARVAWWIGIVALGVRGIKKLFGRGKKEKKENDTDKDTEEPEFWKSWFGKFLKRTGIGTWAYYIIHGLSTGKRGLKDFFDRSKKNADTNDKTKTQVESYLALSEAERKQYEKFWWSVNNFYDKIRAKEEDSWWDSDTMLWDFPTGVELNKWVTADQIKWVVPFCMNNSFTSVDTLLSEEWIAWNIISKDFTSTKTKLLWLLDSGIDKILAPFLGNLASWATLWFASKDANAENIKKWIEVDPEWRQKELEYFFRQYGKVLTYMEDKKKQLEYKIASVKREKDKWNFDTLESAMEDDIWMKSNVDDDVTYKKFLDGKLYDAIDILSSEDLLNANMSSWEDGLENVITVLDDERDQILNYNKTDGDAIKRAKKDVEAWTITADTKEEMEKVCERLEKDVDENFEETWSMSLFGFLHTMCNSNDKAIKEYLKNSGMDEIKAALKTSITENKAKLTSWAITVAELKTLLSVTQSYFAFKKETLVSAYTMQNIRSENWSLYVRTAETAKDFAKDFINLTKNWIDKFKEWWSARNYVVWYVCIYPAAYVTTQWVLPSFIPEKYKLKVKRISLDAINFPYWATKKVVTGSTNKILRSGSVIKGNARYLRKFMYNGENADDLIMTDMFEGRLNIGKADKIITAKKAWFGKKVNWTQEVYVDIYDYMKKKMQLSKSDAIALFGDWEKIPNYMKNTSLQKNFFSKRKISWITDKFLLKKTVYKYAFIADTKDLDVFRDINSKLLKYPQNKKLLIKGILENWTFDDLTNLDDFVTKMDGIDNEAIKSLEPNEIEVLVKKVSKDISTFKTADEINQKIQDAKDAFDQTKNTTDVLKDLTADQKKVYNRIDEDIKELTDANTALKKTPGYVAGNATEVSNNSKMLKMKEWQLKLKKFDTAELDAFAALRKLEFKSNHIVEILELKKIAAIEKEIKKLENGAADVSGLLKQLKTSKAAWADISETLIKTLDDIHTKNLLKSADEVAEFVKDIFKILAKIT